MDFEKAFDSINWDLILNTFEFYHFGDKILELIKSIQLSFYSYILQNGHVLRFQGSSP